ncbi:MAG: hypothetical protein IB616_03340 [Methanosarcinales archaeon]|nr:MAG: hypothetical protein IB616_03340 [Methanosarcinales archaeon]
MDIAEYVILCERCKTLVLDGISNENGEEPTVLDLWNKDNRPGIPHCTKCWCTSLSVQEKK